MTEPVRFDVERLLRALDAHGLEFVVVGGVAAGAHGATRATEDLDLVARRTNDNLDRLAAAMRDVGARLRVAGLDDSEAEQLPSASSARRSPGWSCRRGARTPVTSTFWSAFRTGMAESCHTKSWSTGLRRSVFTEWSSAPAALDDIIASKEWADRPKDRDALPKLRALREVRRRT